MAGAKGGRRGVIALDGAVVDRMMQEKRGGGTKYLLLVEVDRATFERSLPTAPAPVSAGVARRRHARV